jgi:hypothetical protein
MPGCARCAGAPAAPAGTDPVSSDAPLLERLAGLPAVPVAELVALLQRTGDLARDPLFAGLVGVDEEGSAAVHPLLAAVVEHLAQRPDATCYAALLEALTGIWNAAVRGAVVAGLRRTGIPPDDLLLRLGSLSPTLGFHADNREWARQWMADPTAQDAQLVQQCLIRLLLAVRGLAEARARALLEPGPPTPGQEKRPGHASP